MRISDWSSEVCSSDLALDAAIGGGTLTGLHLGEAHLDRARALVAAGALAAAREDIDAAPADAADDPLARLLSATHARRRNDRARAQAHTAEALTSACDRTGDSCVREGSGCTPWHRRW